MENKRSHKLSVYLLKKNVHRFKDALKNPSEVKTYKLRRDLGMNGAIFVGPPKENKATWVELLQQGTNEQLMELSNTSNRAVILLKSERRIFAIPFGFGRHLLKEAAIDQSFGLKTAINMIDADKLRSLNKANVDDFAILTTTQTSRRAKPQEFNIDTLRDLLRGVTGEPFADYDDMGSFNLTLILSTASKAGVRKGIIASWQILAEIIICLIENWLDQDFINLGLKCATSLVEMRRSLSM